MSIGDWCLQGMSNDLLTIRAVGDKILLSPKANVQVKHREWVRKHKAAILEVLRQWPDSTCPANAYARPAPAGEHRDRRTFAVRTKRPT